MNENISAKHVSMSLVGWEVHCMNGNSNALRRHMNDKSAQILELLMGMCCPIVSWPRPSHPPCLD